MVQREKRRHTLHSEGFQSNEEEDRNHKDPNKEEMEAHVAP